MPYQDQRIETSLLSSNTKNRETQKSSLDEVRRKINGQYGDFVLEMVSVPAGEFMMGSNDGGENEKPMHRIEVDGFYLGKYGVTQREWKAVI